MVSSSVTFHLIEFLNSNHKNVNEPWNSSAIYPCSYKLQNLTTWCYSALITLDCPRGWQHMLHMHTQTHTSNIDIHGSEQIGTQKSTIIIQLYDII